MIADRIRSIQTVSGGGGGGFDPSQLSGLKLWLKADTGVTVDGSGNVSSWADQSGNGKDVSQADAAKRPSYVAASVFQSKPGIRFPATGDFWLRTANPDISAAHVFVAYAPYDTTADRRILGFSNADNSITSFLLASSATSSGKMQFTPSSTSVWASSTVGPTYGILNKVSFYNDAINSYLQVNGNSYTEAKHSGYPANTIASNKYFNISQKYFSGGKTYGNVMNGLLLEVIVADSVNSSQIQAVFDYFDARYQTADPYYPVSSLILNMQGTAGGTTFIDESPNAFTVTPYGNAQLVSDATFGTVASFDGTGDYLLTSTNSILDFGTGDFTVEAWINLPNTSSTKGIISGTSTGSFGFRVGQSYNNNPQALSIYRSGVADCEYCLYNFSINAYYHIAVCRISNVVSFYVNGIKQTTLGSGGATNSFPNPVAVKVGGTNGTTEQFNGRIGPLRITKGVARYTANFTPPTGLFLTS